MKQLREIAIICMEGRTVGSLDGKEEVGAMLLDGSPLGSIIGQSDSGYHGRQN